MIDAKDIVYTDENGKQVSLDKMIEDYCKFAEAIIEFHKKLYNVLHTYNSDNKTG